MGKKTHARQLPPAPGYGTWPVYDPTCLITPLNAPYARCFTSTGMRHIWAYSISSSCEWYCRGTRHGMVRARTCVGVLGFVSSRGTWRQSTGPSAINCRAAQRILNRAPQRTLNGLSTDIQRTSPLNGQTGTATFPPRKHFTSGDFQREILPGRI